VSETGTSNAGICDITFPADIRLVTQIYYGSIGFATAATLGVDVARQELEDGGNTAGRTILLTGDGSMALTIQEIGTMIKNKCKAIIFVLNNDGYTVERLIWGARQRTFISFPLVPMRPILTQDSQHTTTLFLTTTHTCSRCTAIPARKPPSTAPQRRRNSRLSWRSLSCSSQRMCNWWN